MGKSELAEAHREAAELRKQLSITTMNLDACARELATIKQSLQKSQERVTTLTTAVAAAEEAAAEKWSDKIHALHSSHRAEHAAATQAWHEHSSLRLENLKHQLQEQFAAQSEELQRRCSRLEKTNARLEETNTETLQAAEQAAELANDLMAQFSESERARSAEQTKFNAQVLTLEQAVRSAERATDAKADENRSLHTQLTKLHAQIDHYASLLEAEEEHHSIGDRPSTTVRMLKPALLTASPVRAISNSGPTTPGQYIGHRAVQAVDSPDKRLPGVCPAAPGSASQEVRVSIGETVGYGGLTANYGLQGVMPVSPNY